MKRRSPLLSFAVLGASALIVGALASACGGADTGSGFDNGGDASSNGEGGFGLVGDGSKGPCTGIACNVANCGGTDTTISGTVYAPNGTLPLYNVIVYVPNSALTPFTDGVSCDACGSVSGNPITTTTSDASGKFKLKGVPVGKNIPLVFQVGKWRREVTIDNVAKCTDNPITDPNLSRLPKNHAEGAIPRIAVTTGGCDKIACVLPKMGLDASEFGIQSDYSAKKVILYAGSGDPYWSSPPAGITPANNLWGSASELAKYDLAIFSCECDEHYETKPAPAQQNVYDYLNAGGRTFGTDFMYTWIHTGTESSSAPAPTDLQPLLQGFVGGAPGGMDGNYDVNTTFPKGAALDSWLQAVGGSTVPGKVPLSSVWSNYANVDPSLGQEWVHGITGDEQDRVITYTTPFSKAEADRCGKSYYLDVHVGDATDEDTSSFPANCGTALTPQEKMMVFFLMDLASCIQDDSKPVNPPR